jgi:hypothetical protein
VRGGLSARGSFGVLSEGGKKTKTKTKKNKRKGKERVDTVIVEKLPTL